MKIEFLSSAAEKLDPGFVARILRRVADALDHGVLDSQEATDALARSIYRDLRGPYPHTATGFALGYYMTTQVEIDGAHDEGDPS